MDPLTKLFSPSCWVPGVDRDQVMQNFFDGIQNSYQELKSDEKLERIEDLEYGKDPCQKIDVWGDVTNTNLLIFFHGGYWAAGTRKDCLTPVRCALKAGYTFASIGYGLATNDRTISDCIDDAVAGVKFLLEKFPNFQKVLIGGHSAGAHLAVKVLTSLPSHYFSGAVLFSGCYLLDELVGTEIGQDISLTPTQAKDGSCDLQNLFDLKLPTLVVLGLLEAPKLIEQNRKFPEDQVVEVAGSSHYTIMTNMVDEGSEEFREVVRFLTTF